MKDLSTDRLVFVNRLLAEGFAEPVTVNREANGSLDLHTHPFEAKALILEGEIRICWSESDQVYKAGDIFSLGANTPHTEHYGPNGVTYLVGRKSSI
jgi:quercetin dioxygenase-like cupin family protein